MDPHPALELIATAVPAGAATWADFGAGEGTFTRALAARLGRDGVVYAIDRDARALATLRARAEPADARVITVHADFARDTELGELAAATLDGLLFANSLHYVSDAGAVLARLVARLAPGGRVVVIEYDRRRANPWVPHPIPPARLAEIAVAAGLAPPRLTATRPSSYGGDLYAAVAGRVPG